MLDLDQFRKFHRDGCNETKIPTRTSNQLPLYPVKNPPSNEDPQPTSLNNLQVKELEQKNRIINKNQNTTRRNSKYRRKKRLKIIDNLFLQRYKGKLFVAEISMIMNIETLLF